jgi:hypothetical protein
VTVLGGPGRGRGRERTAPSPAARPSLVTLHVAIVTAADGIRFAAAEPTADLLCRRLTDYVRARARYALWPEDARRVARAFAAGQGAAAVAAYFATVGRRWDPERVVRASIDVELPPGATSSATASRTRR